MNAADLAAFRDSLPPGPDIDPEPVVQLTEHARNRADEMGVTEAEIAAAFDDPEYERGGRYHPDRRLLVGGRIVLVTYLDDSTVLTVLWRGYDKFERSDS